MVQNILSNHFSRLVDLLTLHIETDVASAAVRAIPRTVALRSVRVARAFEGSDHIRFVVELWAQDVAVDRQRRRLLWPALLRLNINRYRLIIVRLYLFQEWQAIALVSRV